MTTSMGDLHCQLYWRQAPLTVANFVSLARGLVPWTDPATGVRRTDPLYPGTTFHRVIPGFMVQAGDPLGTGTGGPGWMIIDEISPDLRFDRPGLLAMANSGPNTNGSQWFITEVPVPHLDGKHTIFGACDDDSLAVVKAIARVPVGAMDKPLHDVVIESMRFR
ncbi:MAG: peptidylprolyl isomerase [Deltaproteobacteria bacterium]|nr:MAG: peptidylprolyl isomerase [Deltaproteobacteria bacterium]